MLWREKITRLGQSGRWFLIPQIPPVPFFDILSIQACPPF